MMTEAQIRTILGEERICYDLTLARIQGINKKIDEWTSSGSQVNRVSPIEIDCIYRERASLGNAACQSIARIKILEKVLGLPVREQMEGL